MSTDKSEGNYPVYSHRETCAVVFCDELAYDFGNDDHEWYEDHPRCSPVFLCKYHYDNYQVNKKMADKREEIRRVLNAYPSIIDFDESKEVYHLFMDLVSVMEED